MGGDEGLAGAAGFRGDAGEIDATWLGEVGSERGKRDAGFRGLRANVEDAGTT